MHRGLVPLPRRKRPTFHVTTLAYAQLPKGLGFPTRFPYGRIEAGHLTYYVASMREVAYYEALWHLLSPEGQARVSCVLVTDIPHTNTL